MLQIEQEKHAYLIGFLQGDGTHTEASRNRGRISIELKVSDRNILESIGDIYSDINLKYTISERTRDTNFVDDYTSSTITVHNFAFRTYMKQYVPAGKKTKIIKKPDNIHEIGYWRGMIDSDGSVCISSNNIPLVSLVVSSENIKNSFCKFLKNHLGIEKRLSRNTRDDVYNITVTREDAVKLSRILYENASISLDRKREAANEVMKWSRPIDMKRINYIHGKKKWEGWEDLIILNESLSDSMIKLNRSEKSIKTRIWRLST